MKPKALTVLLLGALCAGSASAQTGAKPKLVVNIVISQMRADYMDRFLDNFSADGFRRFMDQGAYFTDAHYNYMQTNTAAGLATLSTGTNPDGHGIVAEDWIDFTTNNPVNLIADPSVTGLDCDAGVGCYSPLNLTAATLGDRLKERAMPNPKSSRSPPRRSRPSSAAAIRPTYSGWMRAGAIGFRAPITSSNCRPG